MTSFVNSLFDNVNRKKIKRASEVACHGNKPSTLLVSSSQSHWIVNAWAIQNACWQVFSLFSKTVLEIQSKNRQQNYFVSLRGKSRLYFPSVEFKSYLVFMMIIIMRTTYCQATILLKIFSISHRICG